jgi:hypothetical protein
VTCHVQPDRRSKVESGTPPTAWRRSCARPPSYASESNAWQQFSNGDLNTSPEYADAVESLYAVSYALKFVLKRTEGIDYAVRPLEGLWWVDDMRKFNVEDKGAWKRY